MPSIQSWLLVDRAKRWTIVHTLPVCPWEVLARIAWAMQRRLTGETAPELNVLVGR